MKWETHKPDGEREHLTPSALRAGVLALLLALWPATAVAQEREGPPPLPHTPEVAFIESLYRAGDDFRAESEAMRLIFMQPDHPARAGVELLRAKVYYRGGQYAHAELILYALLDRPLDPLMRRNALLMLAFSRIRQGKAVEPEEARAIGRPGDHMHKAATMGAPPSTLPTPEAARMWSAIVPGAGYMVLGQPGRGSVALGLNAALLYGAWASWQGGNAPVALMLLFAEMALYSGGRDGAAQEATRLRQSETSQWRERLLKRLSEPQFLATGIPPGFVY